MSNYKNLTFWRNLYRQRRLKEFQKHIEKYFCLIGYNSYRDIVDTAESKKIREMLNKQSGFIQTYLLETGVSLSVTHTPPPAIGGYVQKIDLVDNLFNIQNYDIEPQVLVDTIDKALGVYEADLVSSLMRTFNPLYWLGRLLELIASIPFYLLGSLGLNRNRFENSVAGRLAKRLIKVGTLILGVWEALERLKVLPGEFDLPTLISSW